MTGKLLMLGAVAALVVAPAPARAQCTGAAEAMDACQKTRDLVTFLSPQLAGALAGGNHTLGQGGALGGLGHFALDVRATVINGSFPKLDNVGLNTSGAASSPFNTDNQMIPGVVADAGLGLWGGYSLGVTHTGAIDLLVNATYLPSIDGGDVSLKTGGSSLQFGYGVRVGLLEESLITPGVAISYLTRSMPEFSLLGNVSATSTKPGGSIALNNFNLKANGWRLTAAKDLLIFNVNAGIGQDTYKADATISATVNAPAPIGTKTATGTTNMSMTRTNMFVGLSLNLFIAKIVAEVGQTTGGSLAAMTNSFGGSTDAAKSRGYFSAGLRFGF